MEDGSLFQRMRQIFQEEEKEEEQAGIEAAKLIRNRTIGAGFEIYAGRNPLQISNLPGRY